MNKILFIFFYCFMIIFPVFISAQEAGPALNLDKLADDYKFRNGMVFIELGKVHKALQELQEYLEIYHDGIHRGEAMMQIGDIYFGSFEYQKARAVYRGLYEEFSDCDDGVQAYYKIGICNKKMGYDKEAMKVFKSILKEHSASLYAEQAQLQLDLLDILNE